MSGDDGMYTDDGGCDGRIEVHYQFPGRRPKYYLLTTGSGYPSAEFRLPLSPGDRRLVVPEAGKSSADPPPEA